MVGLMDTQDFLYILGLEQPILQLLFLAFSNKQWQNMDSPHGLGLTGEVRMLKCPCTCCNIHSGVLGEAV